jgi:hypothetical protein
MSTNSIIPAKEMRRALKPLGVPYHTKGEKRVKEAQSKI